MLPGPIWYQSRFFFFLTGADNTCGLENFIVSKAYRVKTRRKEAERRTKAYKGEHSVCNQGS